MIPTLCKHCVYIVYPKGAFEDRLARYLPPSLVIVALEVWLLWYSRIQL